MDRLFGILTKDLSRVDDVAYVVGILDPRTSHRNLVKLRCEAEEKEEEEELFR